MKIANHIKIVSYILFRDINNEYYNVWQKMLKINKAQNAVVKERALKTQLMEIRFCFQ